MGGREGGRSLAHIYYYLYLCMQASMWIVCESAELASAADAADMRHHLSP
jgi:hypothetical protein